MNQEDILLDQAITYADRLNDVVIGPIEYSVVELINTEQSTLSEVQTDTVSIDYSGGIYRSKDLEGITIDRKDQEYHIVTADELSYARVYYTQNILENIAINSAMDAGYTEERYQSEMNEQELLTQLTASRSIPLTELYHQFITQISSSDVEFHFQTSESGEIISFEVSQKIFPDTSLQEYDRTVQNVLNAGLNGLTALYQTYPLPEIKSQYLRILTGE